MGNILEEGKRPGLLKVFLSQFADLLIVILLIAALISMCSGNVESTIVITVVLVMNAVLGTVHWASADIMQICAVEEVHRITAADVQDTG